MMYDEDGVKIGGRFTVVYQGYIFYGDSDGWNYHDYDKWEDALEVVHAYGDMISVYDNEYDVTFSKGEWF